MIPESLARVRPALVVLALVAGACGPTGRAPASVVHAESSADAGVQHEDDDGDDATDSEVEVASELAGDAGSLPPPSPCPANMVLITTPEVRVCVDRYEASLVEVDADGTERAYPHWLPVDGHAVRAVSEPGVFPQGYISEVQAEDACNASGKRLCSHVEWKTACMGPSKTTFPYGDARQPGTCHDTGKSAVGAVFGMRALTDPVASAVGGTRSGTSPGKPTATSTSKGSTASSRSGAAKPEKSAAGSKNKPGRQAHVTTKGRAAETTKNRATRLGSASSAAKAEKPSKRKADKSEQKSAGRGKRVPAKASARPASVEPSVWTQLNDPRLGQVDGALAKTGTHEACVNGYGVLDMVGNLHEWVKTDPAAVHGTFAGGYYLDTALNGDGCQYRTTAHAHDYHDYSTGFRCCADPKAAEVASSGQD
jgi:hypothetical protein